MQNNRFKNLYNRVKRKLFANLLVARILIFAALLAILGLIIFIGYKVIIPIKPYLLGQNLSSTSGRTNILLMGMRGESMEGPDMTDTMILVSLKQSDGQVTLISLPRDLWSEDIKAKINSAYHLGFLKEGSSGGIILAKKVISDLTGIPLHYAVIVDFSLFTGLIDALGGVDIDVPRTFDDYKYPVTGKENDLCNGDPQTLCRYEHLHFDQGVVHMNGETALKYVRSRQSPDLTEGTDFARSRRQEQLISAVKSRLISQKPTKYVEIYRLIRSSVITDLAPQNYLPLGRIALKSRKKAIQSLFITQDNLLDNPPISSKYNNQWVLIPKNGDPALIPNYFKTSLP